jgi:hypothetical protein
LVFFVFCFLIPKQKTKDKKEQDQKTKDGIDQDQTSKDKKDQDQKIKDKKDQDQFEGFGSRYIVIYPLRVLPRHICIHYTVFVDVRERPWKVPK